MRNRSPLGARSARAATVAIAAVVLAGCGPHGDRAGRFCLAVRRDQPAITAVMQGTSSVDKVVDRFHALERTAPIAIEDDWAKLTDLVEAAAAIQPGDAEAQARLTTAAYEADGSVRNVVGWVRATCGVDLTVPVAAATTAPAATTPAPATTR
jgi:hypothetical protein